VSDSDLVFLETTRRLAPPALADEDVRVALQLLKPALGADGRLADLGCGYGRHLVSLAAGGAERLVGVDRSALLLAEARKLPTEAQLVRGDLRALPLRDRSLDAAACFYSAMFLGTDEDARAALVEARRALKPRGLLVLTTDNPLRLARTPQSGYADEVPGLGRVLEQSAYDQSTGVDTVVRRIEAEGREPLSATFRIRYYPPSALAQLARAAGFTLERLEPEKLTEDAPQLVALLSPAP
jgi:SAM-dependent methyltransferase